MSLIGKKVSDFKVQAYVDGKFKEVTLEDVKGKMERIFSSIRQILPLCALQSWRIWPINMRDFQKIGCDIYSVSCDNPLCS